MIPRKTFMVTVEPYDRDLFVSIGVSKEQLIKDIKKEIKQDTTKEFDGNERGALFSFKRKNEEVIFWLWVPRINRRTIAHEVWHATKAVLYYAGVELSDNSEESFAYLNGYLTEIINKGGK